MGIQGLVSQTVIHKNLTMKLVYWGIPGRAHVTRAILHYYEQDFEDYHIKKEEWQEQKPKLASVMTYPNLPYLVDGPFHMSESLAIAKHVARKCGCVVSDAKEVATQDMFEGYMGNIH